MVACDYCDEWFHLKCIDLKKKDIESIKHYKCSSCVKQKRKTLVNGGVSDSDTDDSDSDSDEVLLPGSNKGRIRWIKPKIIASSSPSSPSIIAPIGLSPSPHTASQPTVSYPSVSSPTTSKQPSVDAKMLEIRSRITLQIKEFVPEALAAEIEQQIFQNVLLRNSSVAN